MADMSTVTQNRIMRVKERIAAACERCGRDPDEIMIVAVSKQFPMAAVRDAFSWGMTVFGENRVQEAETKIVHGPVGVQWHMVGRLQSNKARQAVVMFNVLHSIDSARLLDRVSKVAVEEGRVVDILLQVNVSGESQKAGAAPSEVERLVQMATKARGVRLQGLMTIGPMMGGPDAARRCFAVLRDARDRIEQSLRVRLPHLSMGMSSDYEVAVEEGATMLRLGTAIFGKRPPQFRDGD